MLYYPDSHDYLPWKTNEANGALIRPPGLVAIRERLQPEPGVFIDLWEVNTPKRTNARCVLLVHGNGQNATAHIQNIFWMAAEEYRLFSFDYRGYGGSTHSPTPQNTVQDTVYVIDQLRSRCSSQGLNLIGQSLGAAVLARALIELPSADSIRRVLLDSGFVSYRQMAVDVLSRLWLTWPVQWLGWLVMSDNWAPAPAMQRFPQVPVMVIHGTADTTVPHRLGKGLYEMIPHTNKTFVSVDGARHTEAFMINRGKYRPMILKWLEHGAL